MKKSLLLVLFLVALSIKAMDVTYHGQTIPELSTQLLANVKTLISTSEESTTRLIKTAGLTGLGVAGAFIGTGLIKRGWKEAFFNKDKKNKTFLNNNVTRGLFTVSCGAMSILGSAYLILKSDKLVQHFS